jgi:protein tyrosine/serine phosphatase
VSVLDGAPVFRDLGGYRTEDGREVRRGRVYRSCALVELTEADVRVLRDRMNLRTVIDLRDKTEISQNGLGPLGKSSIRYYHVSVIDLPLDNSNVRSGLVGRYRQIAEVGAARIVRVMHILANPNSHPVVFHCTAGKDRTGVVAALLLSLLGVELDEIVNDYCWSEHERAWLLQFLERQGAHRHRKDKLPEEYFDADPGVLREFLRMLDTDFGGAKKLLFDAGADEQLLERLKGSLLI